MGEIGHAIDVAPSPRLTRLYLNVCTSTLRTPGKCSFIVGTGVGGRGGWTRARLKALLWPHPKEILKLQPPPRLRGEGATIPFLPPRSRDYNDSCSLGSAVYRYLVEFLVEIESRKSALTLRLAGFTLIVLISALMFAVTNNSMWIIVVIPASALFSKFATLHDSRHRAVPKFSFMDAESLVLRKWLQELSDLRRRKQLEKRSHPPLIEELEACARLRFDILAALRSSQWRKLATRGLWSEVREQCGQAANSLLLDALWAARPLIRPLGARIDTFERRCADPAYTEAPYRAIGVARSRLAELLAEVSDEPFSDPAVLDSVQRAKNEILSLKQAEAELHEAIGDWKYD